ncbi:DUF2620 domain-containing protein [Lacticaseibacillus hegangensis]|uniref:DUF2620 domain-containing protein n=1 Tax=Lacticaseibacillus hegangensis TaxID=2486010 RepID=A0ABW4D137_9LACO|nr:DUF2620 domain-containing protein [Lacticaseibacillus hegangensis]
MTMVVVGGQMGKPEIEADLKKMLAGKNIDIEVKNDLDAALAVKSGQANYYIGACETGAGGALAMATALLGSEKTMTVASPTKVLSPDEIKEGFEKGKVAFGFTINSKDTVLPLLAELIANS